MKEEIDENHPWVTDDVVKRVMMYLTEMLIDTLAVVC